MPRSTATPTTRRHASCADALASCKDGLGDRGHRDAEVERRLRRPLAGALLRRLVEDDVHERPPRRAIALAQNLRRDLDEVGLEVALVPLRENPRELIGTEVERMTQQVVGLGN